MKIFTKRDCPLCSNGLTEEAISPDISPDDNIDKIGNYWRGFYKDKLFFIRPFHRKNLLQIPLCCQIFVRPRYP